jgi:hypothetical protein
MAGQRERYSNETVKRSEILEQASELQQSLLQRKKTAVEGRRDENDEHTTQDNRQARSSSEFDKSGRLERSARAVG